MRVDQYQVGVDFDIANNNANYKRMPRDVVYTLPLIHGKWWMIYVRLRILE